MSYPATIGGAVFITASGDTAISAWPLHHYQQQTTTAFNSRRVYTGRGSAAPRKARRLPSSPMLNLCAVYTNADFARSAKGPRAL